MQAVQKAQLHRSNIFGDHMLFNVNYICFVYLYDLIIQPCYHSK
jgi:hypothetical protein